MCVFIVVVFHKLGTLYPLNNSIILSCLIPWWPLFSFYKCDCFGDGDYLIRIWIWIFLVPRSVFFVLHNMWLVKLHQNIFLAFKSYFFLTNLNMYVHSTLSRLFFWQFLIRTGYFFLHFSFSLKWFQCSFSSMKTLISPLVPILPISPQCFLPFFVLNSPQKLMLHYTSCQ